MNLQYVFFCTLSRGHRGYLIKVCDDLVEKTETLQSFFIDIRLCVELFEVRDGSEHDTHRLVRLMIEVLVTGKQEDNGTGVEQ